VTTIATAGHKPQNLVSTNERIAVELPVSGAAGVSQPWLMRLIVPWGLTAGDILRVGARSRVTNDEGYNIGVGYHLHAFVVGQSTGTWWKISDFNGDNVDAQRHHMPLHCSGVWQVPPEWPAGAQAAIVYKGDAHSTAWTPDDEIIVDNGYCELTVEVWQVP
jgi:hypothetical protein